MSRVRIVTDSACDLSADTIARLGIEVVPLTIRFGAEEYTDRVELSADAFWSKLASSSVLPETAAPSPGAFEAVFRRAAEQGASGVVCINLSSKLSATFQAASLAAASVRDAIDVRVVDSLSITMGLGTMCVVAVRPPPRAPRSTPWKPQRATSSAARTCTARSTRWRTSRRAAASAAHRR